MVYNPISGATHVLDVASAEVMLALIEGPADPDALGARLAKLLDIELNAEAHAATQGILENLGRLGLAEASSGAEAP